MASGHQSGAAGIARHPRHIELRESRTFGGHLVDIWRLDLLLSVAAEMAIAKKRFKLVRRDISGGISPMRSFPVAAEGN